MSDDIRLRKAVYRHALDIIEKGFRKGETKRNIIQKLNQNRLGTMEWVDERILKTNIFNLFYEKLEEVDDERDAAAAAFHVIVRGDEERLRVLQEERDAPPPPPRSLRVLLGDLETKETEEGRLRILEEMLENDMIDVTRQEVGVSLRNIKKTHGKKALTDEMTVGTLQALLRKLKGIEEGAAGRLGRPRRRGRRKKHTRKKRKSSKRKGGGGKKTCRKKRRRRRR
jgi:hypothetical protein